MGKFKNTPPIVEVFWEDHFSIGDDWFEPGHKHDMCILSAVGYLVSEDDNYYYIACTYELASGSYSAGTAVLKNCVINYRLLSKELAIEESERKPYKTKGTPLNVELSRGGAVNKKRTPRDKHS